MADVSRGTAPAVSMRFTEPLRVAIEVGWKTQSRRVLGPRNSLLTRGNFHSLDLASGHPDGFEPVSSLRCRINTTGGDRRSVVVESRIKPPALLWPRVGQGGWLATRESATKLMRVHSVGCMRLNDLSEDDAYAEGVRIFAELAYGTPLQAIAFGSFVTKGLRAAEAARAYEYLHYEVLGKTRGAQWRRGAVHQDLVGGRGATARDAFALLWETLNGTGSWQQNPWVWCYRWELVS